MGGSGVLDCRPQAGNKPRLAGSAAALPLLISRPRL
jgi:hypothetical protein